jgi:2-dehydrotetronate isomerase
LGNDRLHVMASLIKPVHSRPAHRATYLSNLDYAASQTKTLGVTVVIEPINTRDIPGFFINRLDEAHQICKEVGVPERQEPDIGEINYPYLFNLIDEVLHELNIAAVHNAISPNSFLETQVLPKPASRASTCPLSVLGLTA